MRPLLPLAGAAVLLGLSACAAPTAPAPGGSAAPGASAAQTAATTPVAIATTTQLGSILGDITACAGATSATLMRPGTDPHDFALASDQVAAMARAKLVVANGLGLEGGMASALANVKADGGRVYEVAPDVDPLAYDDLEADHAGEAGTHTHEHGSFDPHVALDAGRMARAAENIGKQLTAATGEAQYTACGVRVGAEIAQTDAQVQQILAAIPKERRVLITDHEAFNYFAQAYDFHVAGVVVPGGSTDAEPSSADIARIVAVVKAEGVPAIFSNVAVNPKLVEAVAREAGSVKVVPLHVDSVGEAGSGAETYRALMIKNAEAIAAALA
nr:zinc ABC transporter substrate-binding protein [Propionibacterium sp.]